MQYQFISAQVLARLMLTCRFTLSVHIFLSFYLCTSLVFVWTTAAAGFLCFCVENYLSTSYLHQLFGALVAVLVLVLTGADFVKAFCDYSF